jgi:hypothetical protein
MTRLRFILPYVLALLSLLGCERDFPAVALNETEGYEISGNVTDALGNRESHSE